jgi:hypothetical protein
VLHVFVVAGVVRGVDYFVFPNQRLIGLFDATTLAFA